MPVFQCCAYARLLDENNSCHLLLEAGRRLACRYNRQWHGEELAELQFDTLEFGAAFSRLRAQLPKRVFWRESTAQHFSTISGSSPAGSLSFAPMCD